MLYWIKFIDPNIYIYLMCVTKTIHVWLSWQDLLDIFSDIHSCRKASLNILHFGLGARSSETGKSISIRKKTPFSWFRCLKRSANSRILCVFAIFPFIFLISDNIGNQHGITSLVQFEADSLAFLIEQWNKYVLFSFPFILFSYIRIVLHLNVEYLLVMCTGTLLEQSLLDWLVSVGNHFNWI